MRIGCERAEVRDPIQRASGVERVASRETGEGGEPPGGAPVDGEFSTVDDAWGRGKERRAGKGKKDTKEGQEEGTCWVRNAILLPKVLVDQRY